MPTLLFSLISSRKFLVASLGYYVYYHITCKQWEFYIFFSNLYSFNLPQFPWLGLPKLCWIIMTSVGTLVSFLVLEEMLCFSPLRIACCWFVVYSLFYVEVCSFSLEKGMTPHSCLENSMDRGAWLATVQELQRVGHDWVCMQVPSVPNFRRVYLFIFFYHTWVLDFL